MAGAFGSAGAAAQEYNPLGGELRLAPEDFTTPPQGYRLSALQVIRAAVATDAGRAVLREDPQARIRPYVRPGAQEWFVLFVQDPKILLQVDVDDRSGKVTQVWSGFAADWPLTRGTEGVIGLKLNAPYVWIPLCVLFLLPFFDRKRPLRLLHLDLLVLLGFGGAHVFFNRGMVETSVWLVYPVLGYLLVRMAMLAWRPVRRRERLIALGSVRWLALGIVVLIAVRLVLALHYAADNVVDVGYASVIGADRITQGQELYVFNDAAGDTYGPVAYLAYIPFEQTFPWTGGRDALSAAKAGAIAFDFLTIAGLFVLGRRLRPDSAGTALGVALAYAWTAYPYTAYALVAGTNDLLISALLVWALVLLSRPLVAGAVLGLAAAAKFAPLVALPALARGASRSLKGALVATAAALAAFAAVTVPLLPDGGLHEFYDTTIGFQLSRESPFSPWGQDDDLGPLQLGLEAVAIAIVAATVFVRVSRVPQIAAACALALIAVQAPAIHWFFFYIVWFAPFALVALLAQYVTDDAKMVAGIR